jgi:hypothetical protein
MGALAKSVQCFRNSGSVTGRCIGGDGVLAVISAPVVSVIARAEKTRPKQSQLEVSKIASSQ